MLMHIQVQMYHDAYTLIHIVTYMHACIYMLRYRYVACLYTHMLLISPSPSMYYTHTYMLCIPNKHAHACGYACYSRLPIACSNALSPSPTLHIHQHCTHLSASPPL